MIRLLWLVLPQSMAIHLSSPIYILNESYALDLLAVHPSSTVWRLKSLFSVNFERIYWAVGRFSPKVVCWHVCDYKK